jgi:hypothetical protein
VITRGRTDLTVAFRSSSCATPLPPAMLTTSAIVRHVAMRFPPLAISGFHDRVPTRLGTVELDLPDRVNRKPGSPRLWHWLTKGVVHYEAMYVTKCARRPDTPPQREGDRDVSSAAFLPVPIPAFVSSL